MTGGGLAMSEGNWFTWREPEKLLCSASSFSPRQCGLIALACYQRTWHLIPEGPIREGVRVLERHLDSPLSPRDLNEANAASTQAYLDIMRRDLPGPAFTAASLAVNAPTTALDPRYIGNLVRCAREALVAEGAPFASLPPRGRAAWKRRLRLWMCDLIRDVVGDPSAPPRLEPAWRTPLVRAIAEQAEADRDYSCVPVLADALADAGCDDDALLDHLRWAPLHVRGCWAVELLLGRACATSPPPQGVALGFFMPPLGG
jgi:hypothetical protein